MNFKWALLLFLISVSDLSHALYGARSLAPKTHEAVGTLHLSDPNNSQYDFFCSGVLIASDLILTAGNCINTAAVEIYEKDTIFSEEPNLLKVKIAGVKYAVKDVVMAPSYFEAAGFEGEDLALVKLKKAVSGVAPLKIASLSSLKPQLQVSLVARGKVAESSIVSVKRFDKNYVIFTDGSKVGVCGGDSGGALLVKSGNEFLLAGILSAQNEGCERQNSIASFARRFK